MDVILVLRHAEKPEGIDLGVDETGAMDPESLVVRGWQRAGALVGLFGPSAPLPAPDRIYASAPVKLTTPDGRIGSRSKRPTETVSVLAAKVGQKIDGRFTKGQEEALADHVAKLTGITLVCWQHEGIPTIASTIAGSTAVVPASWP